MELDEEDQRRVEVTLREMRQRLGEDAARVAAILLKHDPLGVNHWINPDEYEVEASRLTPALANARSPADVEALICEFIVEGNQVSSRFQWELPALVDDLLAVARQIQDAI